MNIKKKKSATYILKQGHLAMWVRCDVYSNMQLASHNIALF